MKNISSPLKLCLVTADLNSSTNFISQLGPGTSNSCLAFEWLALSYYLQPRSWYVNEQSLKQPVSKQGERENKS